MDYHSSEGTPCARYLVTSMEGNEPFMTDSEVVLAMAKASDWYYVIDISTGSFWTGEEWAPLERRNEDE